MAAAAVPRSATVPFVPAPLVLASSYTSNTSNNTSNTSALRRRLRRPPSRVPRPRHPSWAAVFATIPPPADDQHHAHIPLLRHKLSLLLTDLVSRIAVEVHPTPSGLPPLLDDVRTLADALHPASARPVEADCTALRTRARSLLWHIRHTLDPLSPSPALRESLESARSACLHTPVSDPSIPPAPLAQLHEDILLLQELASLRRMERRLFRAVTTFCVHPDQTFRPHLKHVACAAAHLGVDDYRVRGKTRLLYELHHLRTNLVTHRALHPVVCTHLADLRHALVTSLHDDLSAKRPAGHAMLLRPRIGDIPNFQRINDTFLRGGQPSSQGLQWLSDYGVTLVVDLRGSDRQNQWHVPVCSAIHLSQPSQSSHSTTTTTSSSSSSINVCNIPIEDFATPSPSQLEQFIALVDSIQDTGGVVFVHCKAGIGRTGTLVACWRIFHGTPVDDALAMESLYSTDGGGIRQESFVRQYADSLP